MIPAKATHEQLKRHNRQLLLRAVVSGLANSRASLAQFTGLAKPTVSDLIAELLSEGLLAEGEFGEAGETGGKRPRLLEFLPNARQIIGASINADNVTAVLANLSGEVNAVHRAELRGATGSAAMSILEHAINGLIAQLDAQLLCIGIGVAGIVDTHHGVVIESSVLDWYNFPLVTPLEACFGVPVYIGNMTELATRVQAAALPDPERLVTLLINGGVEFGMVLDGAHSFGSEIGALELAGTGHQTLAALLSLAPHVKLHLPDPVAVGYHARLGDADALRIIDQHARSLAQALKWVIGLLRPDHITLVGPVVDYGELFLKHVQDALKVQLPAGWLDSVTISLVTADHLSANGAVTLAIQKEMGIP